MKNRFFMVGLLVSSLLSTSELIAAELTAKEVLIENRSVNTSLDEYAEMEMVLVNSGGKARTRNVFRKSKQNEEGKQNILLKFTAPQNVKGTGFLLIEHGEKEDERWLYIPATKRSRLVASGNDSDNFLGSDFTYEDLKDIDFDLAYEYAFDEKSTASGDQYIVNLTAANEQVQIQTGYGKRTFYISKKNFTASKIEYYDRVGKLIKVLTFDNLIQVNSKWRPTNLVMENVKTKHKTLLNYSNFKVNEGAGEGQYNRQELESDK